MGSINILEIVSFLFFSEKKWRQSLIAYHLESVAAVVSDMMEWPLSIYGSSLALHLPHDDDHLTVIEISIHGM